MGNLGPLPGWATMRAIIPGARDREDEARRRRLDEAERLATEAERMAARHDPARPAAGRPADEPAGSGEADG
jgi:hypothetical protein